MKKTPHIIVIRLSAMGDVAMTVPVLRAFVQQNPSVKITMVSRPFFEPMFANIPNVNFFGFQDKHQHKGFFGLLKLFRDLKQLQPTAFLDLHNVLRTKILCLLFKTFFVQTAQIDKTRNDKKQLTSLSKKVFKPLQTVFQKQVNAYQNLGFSVFIDQPCFPEKANLLLELKTKFELQNNNQIIGIAPFAQYQTKVYPIDLMQQVIANLSSDNTKTILLFGGGQTEIEILNQLALNKFNVIVVAGKINFAQELQLISNLNVMLSMDSGNAHLAAMLGVNVVTLWGATHPFAGFAPFAQPLSNCLTADRNQYPKLPTSVYGNKIVSGYQDAMRTILPESIVQKVLENLG